MSKDLQKSAKNGLTKSKTGKIDFATFSIDTFAKTMATTALPRLFYQLVVFVLDGSGSMTYPGMSGKSKGEEIENAVKEVLERLLNSKNKNSFDLSIWGYANESVRISNITPVESFNLIQTINPCDFIKKYDGTNLITTLNSVKTECQDYLKINRSKNAQALIVILSDGALDEYEETSKLCNKIKELDNISVSTIFYESKTWQENYNVQDIEVLKKNMENLASYSSLFTSTLDPEEIRKHMIKSISTVSKID